MFVFVVNAPVTVGEIASDTLCSVIVVDTAMPGVGTVDVTVSGGRRGPGGSSPGRLPGSDGVVSCMAGRETIH